MTTEKQYSQPLLSFDFANASGVVKPYTFKDPVKIIAAHRIEDVLPCLQLVEEAVEQGYYAAGFLSYESAPAFEPAFKVHHSPSMPLLWFGIYIEPEQKSITSNNQYELTKWLPTTSVNEYKDAIQAIKDAIARGDTYQTNYTIRLQSTFTGDDVAFYEKLKKAQSSNYCAYINTGEHSILSASPELFFHLNGQEITTRPMKGTTARGKTLNEDEERANWLFHSKKDRAENVMIVDLLRNDLNRIARTGTVQVPKLYEIERYPTVHQMTSTITAELQDHLTVTDIFKALFPCGSITGAPKISTMNIITQLENSPRNVYCGAIGYITPNKEAIFNVPIRTVMIDQKTGNATYGVGGGITWDSTSEGEYEEVITKASLLQMNQPEFQLLESILLSDGELFLLDEHLNRLEHSAKYFGFQLNIDQARCSLEAFAADADEGDYKIRLLLDQQGELFIESVPIQRVDSPVKVTVADTPINKKNPFLYHKTTYREVYAHYQQRFPHAYDVLLWNENQELTEFTNGNVVLEMDGAFWTPPIQSGLLGGTYREKLINEGKISERILTTSDLKKCSKIWFINSVRKWLEVKLVK